MLVPGTNNWYISHNVYFTHLSFPFLPTFSEYQWEKHPGVWIKNNNKKEEEEEKGKVDWLAPWIRRLKTMTDFKKHRIYLKIPWTKDFSVFPKFSFYSLYTNHLIYMQVLLEKYCEKYFRLSSCKRWLYK